jgi:hypothetical protein
MAKRLTERQRRERELERRRRKKRGIAGEIWDDFRGRVKSDIKKRANRWIKDTVNSKLGLNTPNVSARSAAQDLHTAAGNLKGSGTASGSRSGGRGSSGPTFIQRSREESSEQKAIWNTEQGREFFGVNEEDEAALGAALEAMIAGRLREQGSD